MANNKTPKGNFKVRTCLKGVFGSSEPRKNATYGLGYELTLQRNIQNLVLNHWAGIEDANLYLAGKVFIEVISWFAPRNIPKLSQKK